MARVKGLPTAVQQVSVRGLPAAGHVPSTRPSEGPAGLPARLGVLDSSAVIVIGGLVMYHWRA